jgi:hypothetical protein
VPIFIPASKSARSLSEHLNIFDALSSLELITAVMQRNGLYLVVPQSILINILIRMAAGRAQLNYFPLPHSKYFLM